MYKEQWNRLIQEKALGLTAEDANAIVARAYAHSRLDLTTGSLVDPIQGLQVIKSPSEIQNLPDRGLQMMEFVRMATNMDPLRTTLKDIRKGHPQGTLIATMWGFSSFNALKTYVDQDRIDPASQDPKEMARFKVRMGFMPPSQYLLGRDYSGHTLVIHTDPGSITQWIDQVICTNRLDDLLVAVVRAIPDGDNYLNHYSRSHDVLRKPLSEDHSSYILGARKSAPDHRLAVSIVPARTYTLAELVSSHYSALGEGSLRGSSLIIDRVTVDRGEESIHAGLKLAQSVGINVVLTIDQPDASLWDRFATRVVFGFDRSMLATGHQQMDESLAASSPFLGKKGSNLQLAYHSYETGVRFSVVQLAPQTNVQGATILKRIFGRPPLG